MRRSQGGIVSTLVKRSAGASLLATALISCSFAAETDFAAVQVTAIPVSGKIHMLQGNGGNIGVSIGEDGVLMIDDQFAPLSNKIKETLRSLGGASPKYLLNTHHHGDHSGGNENFADTATILAHKNVRIRLADPTADRVPKALPVITYEAGLSIHFNGEEVRLIHLPNGHTDGDTVIWFTNSNVIHMGDEYVVGTFPFVDLTSGGSVVGLIQNHEKLLAELPDNIKIIPGHGALSTKAEMAEWIGVVRGSVELVFDEIAAGKSLDDIKKAGLPAEYKNYGRGFISQDAWLTAIYNSATNR
jgi:cyclase